MPVHKIPAHALHEDLVALEHDGESVVTITPVHDGAFFVVTTKFHGNNVETRDARVQRAQWDATDPLLRAFVADDIVRVTE